MKIRKGDTITILAGKDRGQSGKVLRVLPKKNLVLIEGLNKFKRHIKKQSQDQPGGIVEVERPIHASNVKLKTARK